MSVLIIFVEDCAHNADSNSFVYYAHNYLILPKGLNIPWFLYIELKAQQLKFSKASTKAVYESQVDHRWVQTYLTAPKQTVIFYIKFTNLKNTKRIRKVKAQFEDGCFQKKDKKRKDLRLKRRMVVKCFNIFHLIIRNTFYLLLNSQG